jgi:hypothetical protein
MKPRISSYTTSHPIPSKSQYTEAEFKEKYGVWDPMPELTITAPYVDSRFDSNTFTMDGQPYARVDLYPLPESPLFPSQGFGLCTHRTV